MSLDLPVSPELYNQIVLEEFRLANAAGEREAVWAAERLADGFREFGQSGRVYERGAVLAAIRSRDPARTGQVDVLRMELVGADVVLLTYLSRGEYGDTQSGAAVALRSSLWCRRDGAWQLLFHQGTPMTAPASTG